MTDATNAMIVDGCLLQQFIFLYLAIAIFILTDGPFPGWPVSGRSPCRVVRLVRLVSPHRQVDDPGQPAVPDFKASGRDGSFLELE